MRTTTLAERLDLICDADLGGVVEEARVSSCAAKMLLMALLRYTDARGVAWPSRPTLARDAGLSVSQVDRTIRALERHAILAGAHAPAARGRSRCRRVDFAALRSRTTRPEGRTATPGPAHDAPNDGAPCATNTPGKEPRERTQHHADHRPPAADACERGREGARVAPGGAADAVSPLVEMGIGREAAERAARAHAGAPVGALALLALGVDARVVRVLLREHGEAACEKGARTACAKEGVRSPAGYAVRAVREGWGPPSASVSAELYRREEAARERAYGERMERETREREAYARQQRENEAALERVRVMPDEGREAAWRRYLEDKERTLGGFVAAVFRKRDPLTMPMAARDFAEWLGGEGRDASGADATSIADL